MNPTAFYMNVGNLMIYAIIFSAIALLIDWLLRADKARPRTRLSILFFIFAVDFLFTWVTWVPMGVEELLP